MQHDNPTDGRPALGHHEPAWEAHADPPSFSALSGDLDVDVCVVGAGITGLTAATYLRHAGVNVAVVEAGRVGAGVTGRSTGHLTELVDAGYRRIEKDHGAEGAVMVRTAARAAIEEVRRLSDDYAPSARYRRVPAYLVPARPEDSDVIGEEAESARRAGSHAQLGDSPLAAAGGRALHVPDQAEFDPLAYVHGLSRGLVREGGTIHEGTRVVSMEPGEHVRLETEAGPAITARRVLVTTHSPLGFHPIQTELPPYRSYVIGFHLPDGRYPQGLFFDTADPYHYIRTAAVGDETVLVVGGADHKTGDQAGADDGPYREVLEYVQARFPGAVPRYHWSAQVFEPVDGLPYIGASPFQENVFFGTGYAGDGLLWGTLAGHMLSDLATGIESPYAEVFNPARIKPLAGGAAFIKENLDVAVRWVKDRGAADVESADDLAAGQGGLLFRDGQHIAAYRDDAGRLHEMSPVCPHLKCIVRWNGADRTWDCPCHGSRFTATGEFMAGPAVKGLGGLSG